MPEMFFCVKNRTKMVIQLLILILMQTTDSEATLNDPGVTPVMLGSTLKQGALCPGERTATITCTAVGRGLTWLVDGNRMIYNANTRVGAMRSNNQSDQTSILMRVDSRGNDSRVASRVSVLLISELPSASAPITVVCHNGSFEFAQQLRFWRKQAETLNMPHVILRQEAGRIYLNWTIPELNEEVHTVAHYSVQIDIAPPILVKNTSAELSVHQLDTTNHTLRVMAVDNCKQQGEPHFRHFEVEATSGPVSTHEVTHHIPSHAHIIVPSLLPFMLVPVHALLSNT